MKKKIIAIIASLAIILLTSVAAYSSINKDKSTSSNQAVQTAKLADKQKAKKKSAVKNDEVTNNKPKTHKVNSNKSKVNKPKTVAKVKKGESITKTPSPKTSSARTYSPNNNQLSSVKKKSPSRSSNGQNGNAKNQTSSNSKKHSENIAVSSPKKHSNNKPNNTTTHKQPVQMAVKVSVYGPVKEGNKALVANDRVSIYKGDKAIDVLKRDLTKRKIPLSYSGTGGSVYIKGINNLFEFDRGAQSGWLFKVNGAFVSRSCGSYQVKNGDVVEWLYTENMGRDRGVTEK